MPIDPRRVKELFHAALDLDDPAERAALLDRECAGDAQLRARLDDLLAAVAAPASALERPLVADATAADFALGETSAIPSGATVGFSEIPDESASPRPSMMTAPAVGTLIAGRYKIRQEIGEGGMGTVYLAEQVAPVKRLVALKLIRAGMDSRQVLARFESERQALAIMDHPHIARVFDAGTTESGHPFFVMELVRGVPLTDYCDRHRLGLPQRLQLFRQVCAAVQHAHQKGVIHRELKPTNILVEDHDGTPVPKVIDFGLAKAITGLQLTEQSLFTAFGSITGTPLYMAPEQATFNAIDIDTRADIYALGVILYELLTGSTPIRKESLQRAAFDEILRVVREDEPQTPSHRISTSEALPSLAANRLMEPARLGRFLRGDLDWIVMKALAKERARRYDSATALANDVERFLDDDPVTAGPPTARYRTAKFIRRHRGQVVAGSLVLLALVGGILGTTLGLIEARHQQDVAERQGAEAKWQAREADRQRQLASAEAAEKEQARQGEAIERSKAERRLAQQEKAMDFVGSIFDDLHPDNAEKDGKPLLARLGERLDLVTEQLNGDSIGDPLAVARIQVVLGNSRAGLGDFRAAIGLFERALATYTATLGEDDPNTLRSMSNLAEAYREDGQPARAIPLQERALAMCKTKLGDDDPITLTGMNNLAAIYQSAGQPDRAIPLLEKAFELQKVKLGPDDPSTMLTMGNLAVVYEAAGQLDRAVALQEQTLVLRKAKLGPEHPATLVSMGNLAAAYQAAGQRDRSIPLHEQVLELYRTKLGPDHPNTLKTMVSLAGALRGAGRLDRAIALQEEVLALQKVKPGPDHPTTIGCMDDLGEAYAAAGKFDRAIPLHEQALELYRAKLGPDDRSTLKCMVNLAGALRGAGQFDRAIALQEQVTELYRAKLGPDDPVTHISMGNLAVAYMAAGQFDRAIALQEQVVSSLNTQQRADYPDPPGCLVVCMVNLATAYTRVGQPARAIPLQERALAICKVRYGENHFNTLGTMGNLAESYRATGQLERSIALQEQAMNLMMSTLGPSHPGTSTSRGYLASALQEAGQHDRAISLRRDSADAARRQSGPDSTAYASALASLGMALIKGEQWTESEATWREVLAIRERKEPDAWSTFYTRSMLGGTLLEQKKYAEAAPLLLGGYEGMKQRVAQIPPTARSRPAEALDRLIRLAEATDKPDEAKAWREEKARIATPKVQTPTPAGPDKPAAEASKMEAPKP